MGGGGGKKQKAPKAPDYNKVAQTEAVENRKTAQELTRWNRPTQIDQFGNKISWTEDGSGNWTQKTDMNPLFAAGQSQALGSYLKSSDEAFKQGEFKAPSMDQSKDALAQASGGGDFKNTAGEIGSFDKTQGDKVAADMYESVMGRARPEQQRESAALDVQLRQQGLQPGTEAYNRSMQNLMTSQGDVATKAGLDATQAGYGAARDIYNTNLGGQGQRFQQLADTYGINKDQDWKSFQGALGLQNQEYGQALQNYSLPMERAQAAAQLYASAPGGQWQGFSGATGYNPADMMGAAQAGYQAKMGGYNANQNKKNNMMSTGGTLGAAAIMSDENLKENITPLTGADALAKILELGGYSYDWRDGSGHDMGVIAQQVQRALPELTIRAANGYLAVKYTGIVALAVEAIKYLAEALNERHE